MTQYIGVDLAWGEGTSTKRANETGLSLIDEKGTVRYAGWARGIDEVANWLIDTAEPGAVIAIDAPLVINNDTGMRLCERQVGMGYGRWHVAANASNTAMGWQGGVALRKRLEATGFVYSDGTATPQTTARTMFECYPYTTIVGMVELGYDDKRPRYKRFDKSLTVAAARSARAKACDELVRRIDTLESASPPLRLRSHLVSRRLVEEASPLTDSEYKHREDVIDALLCAWTAAIWHRYGTERIQVLGGEDTTAGSNHRPVILAPARIEQRVAGRTMKPPRERSDRTLPPRGTPPHRVTTSLRSALTSLRTIDSVPAEEQPGFTILRADIESELRRLSER